MANKSINKHNVAAINRSGKVTVSLNVALAAGKRLRVDVLETMKGRFPRLKKMLADGGYRGQKLIDEAKRKLGIEFSVVLRPDESPKKFSVVPIRWIVICD